MVPSRRHSIIQKRARLGCWLFECVAFRVCADYCILEAAAAMNGTNRSKSWGFGNAMNLRDNGLVAKKRIMCKHIHIYK